MKHLLAPAGLALLLLAAHAHAQPAEQNASHVVKPGETLHGIANRAGLPSKRIIEANDLKPPYTIRIGQTLIIPRAGKVPSPAATARPAAPLTDTDSHIVARGDTLGSIASRAKIPRILIAEANGLAPPYALRVGQRLMLPRTRHHTIKAGDTGFGIAYAYGVPWDQIAIANGMEPDARLLAGKVLLIPTLIAAPAATASSAAPAARFTWPVLGPVRRGFKPRSAAGYHDGIDITAPRAAAVLAVAAGTVIFAAPEPEQFGNLVVVDHGGGWHSAYGSLERITVKKDHKVTKGERVGLVGNTSVTRKTELHFELRKDGKPVDPLDQLPPAP